MARFRQVDVTRLDLRRLRRHAIDFAAFWLHADRAHHSVRHGGSEILQEVHARPRVFNQDRGRSTNLGESDDLAAQIRIFEPAAEDVEEVHVILVGAPGRADRIVVLVARHHGDIPALHDFAGDGSGQFGSSYIETRPVG